MSTSKRFSPIAKALIQEAARKCFGNLPIVDYRTGFKLLKRIPTGPLAINHFPVDGYKQFKKMVPEFTTDLEERRKDWHDRLKRRGKSIPKKGQGKRSKKK